LGGGESCKYYGCEFCFAKPAPGVYSLRMKNKWRPALKRTATLLPSGAVEFEPAGFVEGPFVYERTLEKWLVENFASLRLDAKLIGAQIALRNTKKMDLLAIMRDGGLCIVENKRDCAPREALAQLLEYAAELHELLPAELEAICLQSESRKTLEQIYRGHFKAERPSQPPATPLLVLVADSFEEEEENMALFLNSQHGFRIRLIRYLYDEKRIHDPDAVWFQTVVNETINIPCPVELPAKTYLLRIQERPGCLWEEMRLQNLLKVKPKDKHQTKSLESLTGIGGITLLVYLKWAGFVGYGTILDTNGMKADRDDKLTGKKRSQSGANSDEDKLVSLPVAWNLTLPREHAFFRLKSNQPQDLLAEFKDPELWRSIIGRMQYRQAGLKIEKQV
jgi:hypothetical protein